MDAPTGSAHGASDPASEPSDSARAVLDCLGMKCPRPVIELARRFGELAVGEEIEILADDPAAGPDLAAWCRMRDQELGTSQPPRFVIRRRK